MRAHESRLLVLVLGCLSGCAPAKTNRQHLGPGAWTSAEWQARCRGVRTSFNPSSDLSDATLTLVPGDPPFHRL